jgi:hypothetical protein
MVAAFNPTAFNPAAFSAARKNPSILYLYWRAFAIVMQYLSDRICALRLEFWCQSIAETRADWMNEYGLPDACDPFPDLCTKVAAIGGTRCEYYAEVAARSGWSIQCGEALRSCGSHAGFARAGRAKAGATLGFSVLRIIVSLPNSPAYQPVARYLPSRAGRMRAGRRLSCQPDLLPLQCILSRVIHAEILQVYEVTTNV